MKEGDVILTPVPQADGVVKKCVGTIGKLRRLRLPLPPYVSHNST
jgi:hypothetical protein